MNDTSQENCEVIVIGSGMGGMATAAALRRHPYQRPALP